MRRWIIKYILFLAILTGLPGGIYASKGDTLHIKEVEILHSIPVHRLPMISSNIDTLTMTLMAGRSLSELLQFNSTVHIKTAGRGALSTASFRGTDASHTKVQWNGMRLNSAMLGQVDFSLLPVWLVDDISLLYGGSSLKEGSGALGGMIMLGTSVDWSKAFSISLNQEIASYGTLSSYGKLSGGDEKIRSDTRIYWNRSLNDYPFLNTDVLPQEEQKLEQAGYKKGGVLQEIHFRPGLRHELSLRLWYQEAERELPPLMSQEGASREEVQEDQNLRTSMEWKMYQGFGMLSLRTGYAATGMHYHLYHKDLDYSQFNSDSKENSLYNSIQVDLKSTAASRFQVRADYNRHKAGIHDRVHNEGYEHLRNEGSLMASAYREAGKRWVIYALLREEWADGKWLPLMPSAGFRFKIMPEEGLFLKTNLSRNYNLPSLNDLYWIPGGNPDLRPENSINGDLSLEFNPQWKKVKIHGSVNIFAARVEDWILWKPTQFRYWEAENLALVYSRGTEVQVLSSLLMGDWHIAIKGAYTYTRSTNEGNQLIYIPLHGANAFLNISKRDYTLNYSLSYTGKRYTPEYLNSYTLQDLHLGKSWNMGLSRAALRFSIYNLFNIDYQAIRSRPMPWRNYAITLSIEI